MSSIIMHNELLIRYAYTDYAITTIAQAQLINEHSLLLQEIVIGYILSFDHTLDPPLSFTERDFLIFCSELCVSVSVHTGEQENKKKPTK